MKQQEAIGGQAVVEGVMMIAKEKYAIAVRKPNKTIKTIVHLRPSLLRKYRHLFLIRGVLALGEMMVIGTKALIWSADQNIEKQEEKINKKEMSITLIISSLMGIGFFIVLPFLIARWITKQELLFNMLDGVFRVGIFVIYLLVIARMKEIQRIFQYHGAEHMAVHCYEHHKRLTVKEVRLFTILHPRCGTAFLVIVLLLSIIVFSFIWSTSWIVKVSMRIILIPIIAGLSYEILKFSAKHQENILFKLLITPGLWFQKITTQRPSKDQIEVAIAALKAVLSRN